jgi:hypothetical protein
MRVLRLLAARNFSRISRISRFQRFVSSFALFVLFAIEAVRISGIRVHPCPSVVEPLPSAGRFRHNDHHGNGFNHKIQIHFDFVM